MCEDKQFERRDLASSVASKVFYHLEELDDALRYALGSGSLFDVDAQSSEYVQTLISRAIDCYIKGRVSQSSIDPRLESIVERMFQKCFTDGQYHEVLGIAIESERLDIVMKAVEDSNDASAMLKHCFSLSQSTIQSRAFRTKFLRALVDMYERNNINDYGSICQCLLYLDDAKGIANVLHSLLSSDDACSDLHGFQVAFDLSENQNQPFLLRVAESLSAISNESSDFSDVSLTHLRSILSGDVEVRLALQFFHSKDNTDILIMKDIKEMVESRNSVTHFSAVTTHALLHACTGRDNFLRKNLDWLTRANNWSKFSATASFGVIHRGHHAKSMQLLEPYLPKPGIQASPFLEGGALYGLGLIHANQGGDKLNYLLPHLAQSSNETVQHGACLGIGLNALATYNPVAVQSLKELLYQDNAVSGEAAGIGIGMVELGSGNHEVISEMITYARETSHEKTIRGLALGVALAMYGQEEDSDTVVEQLIRDKDPILRYGACFTIAMAFAATGNNSAIERLLHVAVSDVSNDVRRSAVISLGFVLCHDPVKLPRVVALLAESYNPHVRYGSAVAIGIACSGTASKTAITLLSKLIKDRVDYVRQGALIGMAMVLMQVSAKQDPYVAEFRENVLKLIGLKTSTTMTKMGAILAHGILDGGGRNAAISLVSANGRKRMLSMVGMVVFTQYWYWYPLVHFVSLSFSPTSIIGLTANLDMPANFKVVSGAPPSKYAYPPKSIVKKEEVVKQEYTAELSISAKAKARAAKRKKDTFESDMEVDEKTSDEGATMPKVSEVHSEADYEVLVSPSRVTPLQRCDIRVSQGQRYTPVNPTVCLVLPAFS